MVVIFEVWIIGQSKNALNPHFVDIFNFNYFPKLKHRGNLIYDICIEEGGGPEIPKICGQIVGSLRKRGNGVKKSQILWTSYMNAPKTEFTFRTSCSPQRRRVSCHTSRSCPSAAWCTRARRCATASLPWRPRPTTPPSSCTPAGRRARQRYWTVQSQAHEIKYAG